jgi:hypothetical protein
MSPTFQFIQLHFGGGGGFLDEDGSLYSLYKGRIGKIITKLFHIMFFNIFGFLEGFKKKFNPMNFHPSFAFKTF